MNSYLTIILQQVMRRCTNLHATMRQTMRITISFCTFELICDVNNDYFLLFSILTNGNCDYILVVICTSINDEHDYRSQILATES